MFHPLRPQREQTAIPHHSRLGESSKHISILSCHLPLRRIHSSSKSSFLSAPVNLGPWTALKMQIFMEQRKNKNKISPAEGALPVCLCVRSLCVFLVGAVMETAKTGLKG